MHVSPSRSLLIVAFLVAAPLVAAYAQPGPNRGPRGFPAGLAEVRLIKEKSAEIGVNEETLKKLDELTKETRTKDEALRAELLEATKKTDTLLDTGRPAEKALLETSAAASQISREIRMLRLKCSVKVRALLTDEQLEKFMDIRMKARAGRRKPGKRPSK
jgi:Spy/CpxP family protein refolding chaperone